MTVKTRLSINKNLWGHTKQGLYAPTYQRDFPLSGLNLYLPLWHPELNGAVSVVSKDLDASTWGLTNTTWSSVGRVMTGVDRINAPSANYLNFGTGDFTIIVWVNTTNTAAAKMVIGNDNGGTNYYQMTVTATTNLPCMLIRGTISGIDAAVGTTSVAGGWHMLTGRRLTTTSITMTTDLTETVTTTDVTMTETVSNATGKDTIGADYNAGTYRYFFVGTIGQLIIIKGLALSIPQVTYIYNMTKWRFGL